MSWSNHHDRGWPETPQSPIKVQNNLPNILFYWTTSSTIFFWKSKIWCQVRICAMVKKINVEEDSVAESMIGWIIWKERIIVLKYCLQVLKIIHVSAMMEEMSLEAPRGPKLSVRNGQWNIANGILLCISKFSSTTFSYVALIFFILQWRMITLCCCWPMCLSSSIVMTWGTWFRYPPYMTSIFYIFST